MDEIITLVLSFSLGVGLGVFYFGGLWLTTRRIPGSRRPALMTLGSFAVRSVICLLGFYLIVGNGLTALLISIAGFVLTKIVVVHRLGVMPVKR
jgi:F1F0 ATPase subunit 2